MLAAGFGLPVSIVHEQCIFKRHLLCTKDALHLPTVHRCSSSIDKKTSIYVQCSEDALVVWVGSNIFKGVYGGPAGIAYVLAIIYFGVVVSDMVR